MIEANKDQVFFSDFTRGFLAHPDSRQLVRNTNETAVTQSIRNLILTNKYERLGRPEIGSNVRNILFELASPQTESALRSAIRTTLEKHEPRAKIIDVVVSSIADRNAYSVTIIYTIVSSPNPVTVTIPLQRTR
jgi:phage baseplate assembly protein W